jgi:hypothetical protein
MRQGVVQEVFKNDFVSDFGTGEGGTFLQRKELQLHELVLVLTGVVVYFPVVAKGAAISVFNSPNCISVSKRTWLIFEHT